MDYAQSTLTGPRTQTDLHARLLQVCRELTDHLSAYAISAQNFDDEAFAACQKAERLLFDARRVSGQMVSPQAPLTECCGGVLRDVDGFDVCSGCGSLQM